MESNPHRAGLGLRCRLTLAKLLEVALVTVVFLFWFTVSAPAQTSSTQTQSDPAATEGIEKGWNEFGIWGGISFNAPTLIGKTPDAIFGTVGLRYGRVLAASKTVALEYTIDAIPVALLSTKRFSVPETRETVYGAGLAPIGFKVNFRRHKRLQPFAGTTGGFLYFQRDVPISGAAQFNFTFDFAGGVQIVNSNRRAFTIGYKYLHISNGYRSSINPGVDVQMIYAGFSVFR